MVPPLPGAAHDPDASIEELAQRMGTLPGLDHIIWIAPDEASADSGALLAGQRSGIYEVFNVAKALLSLGYATKKLGWTAVTFQTQSIGQHDPCVPTHAAVHGFLGSVAREYPQWEFRLVDLESQRDFPLAVMLGLPADRRAHVWVRREQQWFRHQLIRTESSDAADAYRRGGVYVVIGGAGQIGTAWSESVIRSHQAQVIWIGRRTADAAVRQKLDRLAQLGPRPEYLVADAADAQSLEASYRHIRQVYGGIHGIVHSAVVFSQKSLAEMQPHDLSAALNAKLGASVRVAQVFGQERLDFVLFFSSLISFIRNPRQSHYAAGCAFQDAYAALLARELSCPVKVMHWGYWESDGSRPVLDEVDPASGIGLITAPPAMRALRFLLGSQLSRLAFMCVNGKINVEGVSPSEVLAVHPVEAPAIGQIPAGTATGLMPTDADESARREFDAALSGVLAAQLAGMGVLTTAPRHGQEIESAAAPPFARWLRQSLRMLGTRGLASAEDGQFRLLAAGEQAARDAWKNWQARYPAWQADTELGAQARLVDRTLRALPDILSGRQSATDTMFPDSRMDLVGDIYKSGRIAAYFNQVAADTVRWHVQECMAQHAGASLRILEIGAGTGGTTRQVLESLRPVGAHIAEYCYSDLSKAFLLHGQEQFGTAHPYLTTAIFNVEEPLAEQRIPLGRFNVVIAANVLHATANIRHTLRNAKAALKGGGLLLLNEICDESLFAHLTFGLLEGWWRYEDAPLRIPGSPALYPESWTRTLTEEGFRNIRLPASAQHALGAQIIVAQSDGVVRQVRPAQSSARGVEAREAVRVIGAAEPNLAQLRAYVRDSIIGHLGESLKVDGRAIDPNESFADHGMDSILGIRTAAAINKTLSIQLTTTDLFDYPTVNKLTAYVVEQNASILAAEFSPRMAQVDAPESPAPVAAPAVNLRDRAAETATAARPSREPVAIIGVSGQFAQSPTLDDLWDHLAAGRELLTEAARWDLQKDLADRPRGACLRGGFLADFDRFDPLFFNISGIEATFMDPQQRLFLQEAWKALEDAGYAGASTRGKRCGVFAGYNGGDYQQLFTAEQPPPTLWGVAASVLSARIAYHMDLQGPAITVDTACSSSLVAIHLACQSLWSRETELALAGGVYAQSTPEAYLVGNRVGMLSPHGRCFTFDDRADGFVPGEGVGIVILKRLSEALADGDHIYAVISGSGINQDGATNGLTAPSAVSQERLERQVYDDFAIDPEQIQMVEAHGTGTKLGDPIEFQALTKSFRGYTQKKQYCAIGSIKTNIGHTTAAAGVAGMIKILLSLQHRQIPASLNFETGNSRIDFENSPFFVNTRLRSWDIAPGTKRRAAISSFGVSGTNAHLVIEEAPLPTRSPVARPWQLIVLSARTAAQLRVQAQRLIERCGRADLPHCGDVSFTLLMGRRHCDHRLACVVRDLDGLQASLAQWLDGGSAPGLHVGELKPGEHREQLALVDYGNRCIDQCGRSADEAACHERLAAIADLFVQGYELAYERLFDGAQCSRIPLPTYPFAKDRYWVSTETAVMPAAAAPAALIAPANPPAIPHPLLQQNTSDLSEFRFTSTFTGEEFFLADHRVDHRAVLPAAAQLEMVRAAVSRARGLEQLPGREGAMRAPILLTNIVWTSPVIVDGACTLQVALSSQSDDELRFEIHSRNTGGESVCHSQGRARVSRADPGARIDLMGLLQDCDETIEVSRCYAALEAAGLQLGPAHRSLQSLRRGYDRAGTRFVLAEIELPACVAQSGDQFGLHPSMLDGALQASIALSIDEAGNGGEQTRLPFVLEEMLILGRTPRQCFVVLRGTEKLDIELCDSSGEVCARLKGFSSRKLAGAAPAADMETWMLRPSWETAGLLLAESWPPRSARVLLVGGTQEQRSSLQERYAQLRISALDATATVDEIVRTLDSGAPVDHLLWIAPPECASDPTDERLIDAQAEGSRCGFRWTKALLELGYGSSPLGVSVVTWQAQEVIDGEVVYPAHAAIHGLLGSLSKEYPRWRIRLIDLPMQQHSMPWPLEEMLRLPADQSGNAFAHRHGEWYRQYLLRQQHAFLPSRQFREGGVYVVIGGAGGIGEAFTEHLVREYRAQVVWIGRRDRDAQIERKIERLAALGPAPWYLCADATDRDALERAYQQIKARHPVVHGVIHAAIVLRDMGLANMDEARFVAALAAKIDVSVRLAQVFGREPLESVLFFSAIQSFTKAAGQSNYAAGSLFKDAFARRLAQQWPCAVRVINWGYWGSVGVVASDQYRERMTRLGVGSIEPEEAMQALETVCGGDQLQAVVIKARSLAQIPGLNADISMERSALEAPSLLASLSLPNFAMSISVVGGISG